MRIVYIAGYARIGSTLLDSALGSHPGIFSAGEMTHLFDDAQSGASCGCGQPVANCPLWSEVLHDVGADLAYGARLTRTCERATSGICATGSLRSEYLDLWERVISSVNRRTGQSVLIDASKSMQFAARRAFLLRGLKWDSFAVLHLTRDPRASVWSVRKGGNPIAAGRRFKALSPWKTAATWTAANLVAERLSRQSPSSHLRYEDLVGDPRSALEQISPLTSLSLEPVAELLGSGQALPSGHGISGNRLRRSGPIRLRPDTDWEAAATRSSLAAARLTFPVARRYGYV